MPTKRSCTVRALSHRYVSLTQIIAVGAMLCGPPVASSAQEIASGARTKVLSFGAQFAQEEDGATGAGLGLEFHIKDVSRAISIGSGASVGFRRSRFQGILGLSYSLDVIPVLGFMNAHLHLDRAPKLDVFLGPAFGVSRFRLRGSECGDAGRCRVETEYALTAGVQSGAHVAISKRASGWIQLSVGRNVPFLSAGLGRKF